MKKYVFISAILLCISLQVFAQFSNGVAALQDGNSVAYAVVQSKDGGHIFSGTTKNFGAGSYDGYVVKFDTNGNVAWAKTLGGTGYDRFYSIINSTDGGVVVAGHTNSFGAGNNDMYVAKFDSVGNLKWNRTIGDTGNDYANSIVQTSDGGYLIGGYTTSFSSYGELYIVKLDSSGNLNWAKAYSNYVVDANTTSCSIARCGNDYLVASVNDSSNRSDKVSVLKIDSAGNVKLSKLTTKISPGFISYGGIRMIQLKNGNYAILTSSVYLETDVVVLVIDSLCNVLAAKAIENGTDFEVYQGDIAATSNGGFIVTGGYYNPNDIHSAANLFTMQFNSVANAIGGFVVDGTVVNFEPVNGAMGNCIMQDRDGGFALNISAVKSFMFLKVDSNYHSCLSYGGMLSVARFSTTVASYTDSVVSGGVADSGGTTGNGGTGYIICGVEGMAAINRSIVKVNVFPNPSNGVFNYELGITNYESGEYNMDVYNMLGEKIGSQFVIRNSKFVIDLSGQPAGIYMYRILNNTGSPVATGKLVIEK